jgi:hypothetical protein
MDRDQVKTDHSEDEESGDRERKCREENEQLKAWKRQG